MFTDINVRYSLPHLKRNQLVKKKNSKSVILTLERASESPGGLVKTVAGPNARVSDAVNLVGGPENLHF